MAPSVNEFAFADGWGAVGVARFQAWSRAGCAVDDCDIATRSANHVVLVVAHPRLEAGGRTGRIDPAGQIGFRKCTQDVVDGLGRDRTQAGTDLGRQGVDIGMRMCAHPGQHGDPRTGDTQGDFP